MSFVAVPCQSVSRLRLGSSLLLAGRPLSATVFSVSRIRRAHCGISASAAGQLNEAASSKPVRVGILVSGGGRSLENVCERIANGTLKGLDICVTIASKKTSGAIARAQKFAIPTKVIRMRDHDGHTESFSEAVSTVLDEFNVDLVVLAGWMHFYLIPDRYAGKVINIHPSLIPAFCGKGYYGRHVHEAVVCL